MYTLHRRRRGRCSDRRLEPGRSRLHILKTPGVLSSTTFLATLCHCLILIEGDSVQLLVVPGESVGIFFFNPEISS
jgi:hypothetical protein